MRRLWSYIILTGASLVLMGSSFANVFKKSNSNIEYSDGREMVFRVDNKDGTPLEEPEGSEDQTPAEKMAEKMMTRLDSMKITNYLVATESYDTVKVTLKQDTDSNYSNIEKLMSFNGTLALSSKLDDFLDNTDDSEKFITGEAYLETKNDYPTVNIPVGDHFKDLYDIVKKYKEDSNTDAAESSTSGEGEEAETTYTYNLYLWHDYEDGDSYSQTVQGNDDYKSRVADKIFMNFDISELISLEEEDKEIETLTAYVNVQDANNNSKYEAREVKKAFDTAQYYVSLINAGSLDDYKVTFMYSNNAPATAEVLVGVDGILAWSSTLRATIVCIVIISLLLAVFYRLGALSIVTTTVASVFAGIASIILFSAEFNAAGLIALCVVAIASLACGVIYLTKLKEEAYRGRTLKKANSEAGKKSLLPILDINVVLAVVGVFAYVFGGSIMRSFAIITVLGAIASLILNALVLRFLMWLLSNTTKLQGKYEAFGIDSKNVPNVLNEEKQTYYGSYADKDFTKAKKPIGVVAGLLFVAGLASMITFGVIGKGVAYNNGGTLRNSEIFFETETRNTDITEDAIRQILANTYTYEEGKEDKAVSLEKQTDEIINKTRTDVGEEESETIEYTYYVVKLSTKLNASECKAYYVLATDEAGNVTEKITSDETDGVSGLITERIRLVDSQATADIKVVNTASTVQPEFAPVVWGTLVGIAVSAFYLLIRYRLSRGLASFVVPTMVATIVGGFFVYTRLAVTNYAVVLLPVVAFISLALSIIFMNRERELVLEDKEHDNSVENRKAIMIRATSLSYSPILLVSILSIYIGVNFFGFGASANSWLFLIMIVGVLAAIFFGTVLFGPISHLFYRLFSKVNVERFTNLFKRKKKKVVNKAPRSAEPEERIFIGIND